MKKEDIEFQEKIKLSKMKDKLYSIFQQRLNRIQQKTNFHKDLTINSWNKCLQRFERQGKLMSIIIPCSEDKIEFSDPLGNESKIRVAKDQAIKIITLGMIPDETNG